MRLLNSSKAINISLLTLLSATVSLGAPTPAAPAAAPWPTDDKTLAVIDNYARYAAAAYCGKLSDNSRNNKVCTNTAPGYCGDLAGALTLHQFSNANTISGNIAVNNDKKSIITAFRGTSNLRDVWTDIGLRPKEPKKHFEQMTAVSQAAGAVPPAASPGDADPMLPLCSNCLVHSGFWSAFRGVKDTLRTVIKEQLEKHPDYRVIVTGHSLGGAVATITAAYLRKSGIPVDVYTYGSPRVGNPAFASFVSSQNGTTTRVTNDHDPVTVVPSVLLNYAHTTPEYWFRNIVKEPRNVKICEGVRNKDCSEQFSPDLFKLGDHSSFKYSKGFEPCPEQKKFEAEMMAARALTEADVENWKKLGFVDDVDRIKAGSK